jgi:oligoendopeptidase F
MTAYSKITADLPEWSLTDLYDSREDPRIEADIAAARAANDALAALEGRFLAARADPASLGPLIDQGVGLYEQATDGLWAVGAYASMAASTSSTEVSGS